MDLRPGFVAVGKMGEVCCLKRSIYDLKQSPRAWLACFAIAIQKYCYKQAHNG